MVNPPGLPAAAKQIAMFALRHHDDRLALWLAAADGVQHDLVASAPTRFFKPPYVGVRGWIGVYLDVSDVDWDQLEDLIEDGYRQVATKKLIALLVAPEESAE